MQSISLSPLKPLLYRLKKRIAVYAQRARTRHQLRKLEEHLLQDLGLTRQQVLDETSLPFWQGDPSRLDDESSRSAPASQALSTRPSRAC